MYFVTKMNGCVDIWDIGFKQNNPALSIQVCVLCLCIMWYIRTYVHTYVSQLVVLSLLTEFIPFGCVGM